MDNVEKEIEFGILRNKAIRWVEPDLEIPGCVVERSIRFNHFIKWYKSMKRNNYYHRSTYGFLDEFYVVNWAWITDD